MQHTVLAATVLAVLAPPLAAAELRVEPAQSVLLVRLYKDGPAAAFAHDHVVRATRFAGTVRWEPAQPAAAAVAVEVEVAALLADEPALRRRLGLSEMKEGTRRDVQQTMLGARQLDAERHPRITFRSTAIEPQGEGKVVVRGQLSLHGETREVSFPAAVEPLVGGGLRARATLRFAQSDFGITPYRFAFGAVRNRDEVEMVVELVAR